MRGAADRGNIADHALIRRAGHEHKARIRRFFQRAAHVLRRDPAADARFRVHIRHDKHRLHAGQLQRVIHGFMAVARHNRPPAVRRQRVHGGKQAAGGAVHKKTAFVRAPQPRRAAHAVEKRALGRVQIVKAVDFGNIQIDAQRLQIVGQRRVPLVPRHVHRQPPGRVARQFVQQHSPVSHTCCGRVSPPASFFSAKSALLIRLGVFVNLFQNSIDRLGHRLAVHAVDQLAAVAVHFHDALHQRGGRKVALLQHA